MHRLIIVHDWNYFKELNKLLCFTNFF